MLAASMAVALVVAACSSDAEQMSDPSPTDTAAASTDVAITEASRTTEATPTTGAASSTAPATSPGTTPATTAAPASALVVSFAEPTSIEGWQSQNDPVMGGVSTGEVSWADGAMVFAGELSLENGGGFTSVRGPVFDEAPAAWTDQTGDTVVSLDVTGDGNTYVFQLRMREGTSWIQRFPTQAATATIASLPWSGFEPVDRFLRPVESATPLDRSAIESVAIYLLDEQEGPFRLAVRSIG